MRFLLLITLIILILKIKKVKEMILFDGNSHLDCLYQKSLRYRHHRENSQKFIRRIYTKRFKDQETSST